MATVEPLILTFPASDEAEVVTLRFHVSWIRVVYAPIDFTIYAGYGTSTPIRKVRAGERIDLALPQGTDTLFFSWGIAPAIPDAEYAKAILMLSDSYLGADGASEQSVALATYDSLGQIRGWGKLASSDSLTNRDASAALVSLVEETLPVTIAARDTFGIVVRRSTRDYNVPIVFGAAGRSQLFTLYLSTAVQATLLSVDVGLFETTAAAEIWAELVRINSQPTGGVTIAPTAQDGGTSAADTRRNGTGGAAEIGLGIGAAVWRVGITGAVPTTYPASPLVWQSLYDVSAIDEARPRVGNGEGFGVFVDCNVAATVRLAARLKWIEESV